MKAILIAVAGVMLSTGANASTLIDFDSLPNGGWHIGEGAFEVVTDGFAFSSLGGVGNFGDPGNKGMIGNGSGLDNPGEIWMNKLGGRVFRINGR